jgi:hypothetical protein
MPAMQKLMPVKMSKDAKAIENMKREAAARLLSEQMQYANRF